MEEGVTLPYLRLLLRLPPPPLDDERLLPPPLLYDPPLDERELPLLYDPLLRLLLLLGVLYERLLLLDERLLGALYDPLLLLLDLGLDELPLLYVLLADEFLTVVPDDLVPDDGLVVTALPRVELDLLDELLTILPVRASYVAFLFTPVLPEVACLVDTPVFLVVFRVEVRTPSVLPEAERVLEFLTAELRVVDDLEELRVASYLLDERDDEDLFAL